MRTRRARHPQFSSAVLADARIASARRGERHEFRSSLDGFVQVVRLAWSSDAFGALLLYRAKARWQALGVPILPRLAHRLAMALAQLSIGDPVVMGPGVYIPHGQVVVDGLTEVGSGSVLRPFVTIGLKEGNLVGPTLGRNVVVGTGAKILGPVLLGDGSVVGANAVVLRDVPERATVAGVPAAVIKGSPGPDAAEASEASES